MIMLTRSSERIFNLSLYTHFICAQSEDILKSHVKIVIDLFNDLGFHINFEKSSIEPYHTLVHPSYIWNSSDMSILLI